MDRKKLRESEHGSVDTAKGETCAYLETLSNCSFHVLVYAKQLNIATRRRADLRLSVFQNKSHTAIPGHS